MGNRRWDRYGPSTYRPTPIQFYRPITEDPYHSNFIPYHPIPYQQAVAEENDADDSESSSSVSFISNIPNDMLVKILSYLPVASAVRASVVCKRWHEAVRSFSLQGSTEDPSPSQKPWYFMFTCGNKLVTGFAYDASYRKWYGLEFPCIEKGMWSFSSSNGLVCLMDIENGYRIFLCNPITKDWRAFTQPPGTTSPDYCAMALAVDRKTKNYNLAVVKCSQVHVDLYEWDLSIHLYQPDTGSWFSPYSEVLVGSRGGEECVICDGVLYYLISTAGVLGAVEPRHAVVWYDLSNPNRRPKERLVDTMVQVPCALTCARLMNLREKLVMVGGIGKVDRPGVVKGIGIWELCKKEWKEVARMPHKLFQGFGEFDELFASNGSGDLIYIQSYGSPALLIFDVSQKIWKWASKSPLNKKFPLQIFSGFCFEPRLEIGV
ncbi:F-box/kelch-repeat protein [Rhynchospora pubera]|uniref:F-box/kelch-repeat protein n=1 Tax=Rhynchospora pubera TaxID=906938 RepID=A0AAV8GYV7_9POAL|nr:F-box/kelch-repeat protein [Rhynchospora pubera]